MAVPAHDERDFEFAKHFNLPISPVVQPSDAWLEKTKSSMQNFTEPFTEEGTVCNSLEFDGLTSSEFKKKIIGVLETKQQGFGKVNFKLRDWLFSRQRYWGEPFPLLHQVDAQGNLLGNIEPIETSELPLELPNSKISNLQADPNRLWAKPLLGLKYNAMANSISAKPTPCPSGRVLAGITSATSILKTPKPSATQNY